MTTRKFRFTNRALDALPACPALSASKADEYTDTEMPGLKATVSKTRQIVMYHRYSINGQKRALRIGAYPGISIAEARQKVQENRAVLDRGGDPQEEPRALKAMPTFEHFAFKTKRSAKADESKVRMHMLAYFKGKRLDDISVREVQTYHIAISQKLASSTANRHLMLLSTILPRRASGRSFPKPAIPPPG